MAMATTMEPMLGVKIATSTIASTKLGMVWKNSVKRIITSSTTPAGDSRPAAPSVTPMQQRDRGGDRADQQRDARAVRDAGSDVAAQAVGAEQEVGIARRLERCRLHVPG